MVDASSFDFTSPPTKRSSVTKDSDDVFAFMDDSRPGAQVHPFLC